MSSKQKNKVGADVPSDLQQMLLRTDHEKKKTAKRKIKYNLPWDYRLRYADALQQMQNITSLPSMIWANIKTYAAATCYLCDKRRADAGYYDDEYVTVCVDCNKLTCWTHCDHSSDPGCEDVICWDCGSFREWKEQEQQREWQEQIDMEENPHDYYYGSDDNYDSYDGYSR